MPCHTAARSVVRKFYSYMPNLQRKATGSKASCRKAVPRGRLLQHRQLLPRRPASTEQTTVPRRCFQHRTAMLSLLPMFPSLHNRIRRHQKRRKRSGRTVSTSPASLSTCRRDHLCQQSITRYQSRLPRSGRRHLSAQSLQGCRSYHLTQPVAPRRSPPSSHFVPPNLLPPRLPKKVHLRAILRLERPKPSSSHCVLNIRPPSRLLIMLNSVALHLWEVPRFSQIVLTLTLPTSQHIKASFKAMQYQSPSQCRMRLLHKVRVWTCVRPRVT